MALTAVSAVADSGAEAILFQDIPSVFGASKYDQRIEEAPSSVSIVTAEEIRRYGHRTLGDILRSVRGLYVSYDRNYSYVGVRGFSRPTDYNSRVLVMIDGQRTNENIYHMAMIGTENIVDVDLIERVEVIRGPSSSLYGTSAVFGVVNVITKRGRDYQGTEVSGEYGSLNTRKARVTWGERSGRDETLLSVSGYASDGNKRLYYPEFDTPADNNGVAENLDGDESRNAFLKASRGDFTLTSAFMRRAKAVPTASYDSVFNNPSQGTVDMQGFVSLVYDRELDARSRLNGRLSFNSYRYDGTYANAADPAGVLTKDWGDGQWWTTEWQYTAQLTEQHKVILGLDYQGDIRQEQGNYEVDPYLPYFTNNYSARRVALFAQDEWRIKKDLILNAGLRHDNYSEWGGSTNPRLALIWLMNRETTMKLLYGSAFRAPSPYELYYTPSPTLQPESIQTTELVLERTVRRNLRFSTSIYHYSMNDLIDQQPDYTFLNVSAARATGVELELEGRFTGSLEGRASYTYQNAEDAATGARLSNSPQHLGKFNLNHPLFSERLIAGVEVQYVGERQTLAGGAAKAYTVGNFTLTARRLVRGLALSASVYNFGDARYGDPGGQEHLLNVIPQDRRGWRLKARYEF